MRRGTLAISLVLVVVAWYFWDSTALFPLRIFVVLLHELGHAVAALLTGGEVVRVQLSVQEGGMATTAGGSRFLILNAGYLGSLGFGLLILLSARKPRTARLAMMIMAGVVTLTTLLYLRPLLSFSFGYGVAASLVLVGLALKAPPELSRFITRFIGIFSVLYALFDIRDDILTVGASARGVSDAMQLQQLTFIPAPIWGVVWIAGSLTLLVLLRKRLFA